MLYGCEIWSIKNKETVHLDSFKILSRRMIKVNWTDRMRNEKSTDEDRIAKRTDGKDKKK